MFKITIPTGETFYTEDPKFIRMHTNNCFLLTKREKAEGIAYKGTPYLFKDGTMCHEVDAGNIYMSVDEMAAAIREGVNDV